jgi:hypothetical protein
MRVCEKCTGLYQELRIRKEAPELHQATCIYHARFRPLIHSSYDSMIIHAISIVESLRSDSTHMPAIY